MSKNRNHSHNRKVNFFGEKVDFFVLCREKVDFFFSREKMSKNSTLVCCRPCTSVDLVSQHNPHLDHSNMPTAIRTFLTEFGHSIKTRPFGHTSSHLMRTDTQIHTQTHIYISILLLASIQN